MPTRGIFYGVVVVFMAALILTGSLAAYYYGQAQQVSSQNQRYVGELNVALSDYRTLSGSFNASLGDYNRTLSLLSVAVANMNTSTPAYRNASTALASLWGDYQHLVSANGRNAIVYTVHLLVNFGNGTRRWYNESYAQPGWDGYVVTVVLLKGNVQAAWYPQYGEHLVTGIDGVPQKASKSWFLWQFDDGAWVSSSMGVDQLRVVNGTVLAWTLCGYDSGYTPTCIP